MKRWLTLFTGMLLGVLLVIGCGGGSDDDDDGILDPNGGGDETSGYVVSGGTMTSEGQPIQGVNVGITSETVQLSVTSNASGAYQFTGLENGSYMIIPYKEGYTFQPENRIVTVAGADLSNQNFMGTPVGGGDGNGGGTSNELTVTVGTGLTPEISWTGGNANSLYVMDTAQWGSNYQWSITTPDGQTAGFSSPVTYGVTPTGMVEEVNLPLEPDREYRVCVSRWTLDGNVVGYAIFSTAGLDAPGDGYTVTGAVVDDDRRGISGATVILASGGDVTFVKTTTTDSGGGYTFSNIPDGTYTITATHPSYNFKPVMQVITVEGGNKAVSNFVED